MVQIDPTTERQWLREQIEKYQQAHPRYLSLAQTLEQVLRMAAARAAPLAIIQTRPKSISSFTEKAIRKMKAGRYIDPVNQMTDLCGGRVITQTQAEVQSICEFIEKSFELDKENSVDVGQRLRPSEFGYRSIHYIVQFKPGSFPARDFPVEVPDENYPDDECPMKAEIQVRTMLEHTWAAFAHDRVYKGAFSIPNKWQRELAVLAGMLESVDAAFARIQAGLQSYTTNYGQYLNKEQLKEEIEILEAVLASDSRNIELAHRIGRLAMALGNWGKAIDVFSKYKESNYLPLLRDLGVVICQENAHDPKGAAYREGQLYLEAASAPPNHDADALASLAGTWKTLDEEKTRSLYRQAFETDPSDPYAVSNTLVYEIAHQRSLEPVLLMAPTLKAAVQRCHDRVEVCMDFPWTFYNLGIFHLLLGHPYESLSNYAKAVQLSDTEWMIETSLRLLNQLSVVRESLRGYEWVRRLLIAGRAVKFPGEIAFQPVRELASAPSELNQGAFVIVAGGTDPGVESQIKSYRPLMLEAFRNFHGTLLSGGTTAGVSGLVGEVQTNYTENIRSIGYVPAFVSAGVQIDKRYGRIRKSAGNDFSPLEPLQYWLDLLAAGAQPAEVKLLGLGGGSVAEFEYQIALAFGASVAVLEGSGGAVTELISDPDWSSSRNLLLLPADPMTVKAFIGLGSPQLDDERREMIARLIHQAYRESQMSKSPTDHPSLAEWEQLSNQLKDSNRMQADHIPEKLRQINRPFQVATGREVSLVEFDADEVEVLAEMEHGRWMVERLRGGWKWGQDKDVIKKLSPALVPWSQLRQEEKEKDRETVRKIPDYLARAGIAIGPKVTAWT